jgi:hypothetical protein
VHRGAGQAGSTVLMGFVECYYWRPEPTNIPVGCWAERVEASGAIVGYELWQIVRPLNDG